MSIKPKSLTIGRLAREVGVNLETVRFYERRGLLAKPPRSASGYRLFPAEATRRVRFIRRAQELGFSLAEIRELLSLRLTPTAKSADIKRRAEAKIADIDAKIKSLESMKKTLRSLTKACPAVARSESALSLRALTRRTNEPQLETRIAGAPRSGGLAPSQTGLPDLLACLCWFAEFGWAWLSDIDGLSLTTDPGILVSYLGSSGIQSEKPPRIRPVLNGTSCGNCHFAW